MQCRWMAKQKSTTALGKSSEWTLATSLSIVASQTIFVHVNQCFKRLIVSHLDFPTKVGPVNSETNQFEYIVLTQALKHPTVVLARNPRDFDKRFKTEVMDYLKRSDFLNPLSALNYPLQVVNTTSCMNAHQLYYEPDTL